MNIFTQKEKNVWLNHARKEFRLRLRHKEWKRNKNRSKNGRNKEQRINDRFRDKFKGYKWVKAPTVFSMTENTEQTLEFISELEAYLDRREKVFVNLEDVEVIAQGAIVVLLSIMMKFKEKRIDFNGNFPKSQNASNVLNASGFIEELYRDEIRYTIRRRRIFTHANKVVDPKLASEIISETSERIWGEVRRCMGVQRIYIELMLNTNNHASSTGQGEHHWYTTVHYVPKEKKACFSFIDYGVGIIQSMKTDTKSRFYNVIPKILRKFGTQNDADLLLLLLNGDIHRLKYTGNTSTGKYYHGKGLPCIFKACDENKISNAVVISNNAKVEYESRNGYKLRNSFNGTFIYWELCENNLSIK